ncbi:hypothetical protein E2C01_045360 [Portunus trituberculatus]|uniref:Uncharacterized protein n=1 Tax=Portunus trituberculatus TaxID=210409 RepID=A0A5B7FY49_PORTR|nr:hypothetical protein [Portunus trituberculatus]
MVRPLPSGYFAPPSSPRPLSAGLSSSRLSSLFIPSALAMANKTQVYVCLCPDDEVRRVHSTTANPFTAAGEVLPASPAAAQDSTKTRPKFMQRALKVKER